MKNNFLENTATKIIAGLLLIFASIVIFYSFLDITSFSKQNQNIFFIIPIEVIGVFFLLSALKLLYRFILKLPPKYDLVFSALCLVFMTLFQLVAVNVLELRPIEDLDKVTNMAINIVNGKTFLNDNTYFSMYTNNIPFTLYFSQYLKMCIKFGIRNYTLAGSLLGVFSINISLIFTGLILKELNSRKSAVFFIAANIFNPLIYIWGAFFYTTVIAIPFMMFAIYFIILLPKKTNKSFFYTKIILLSITLYIGTQIRATTSFVLIGAAAFYLVKASSLSSKQVISALTPSKIKVAALSILLSLLCLFALNLGYNSALNNVMDADYSETSFPATHWIMMGLSGNGGYNQEDEEGTMSCLSQIDKEEYTKNVISTRIHDLGVGGLGKLIVDKLSYTWTDGTHDYPTILRAAHNYTDIHKYIIGDKRDGLVLYCQIFNITLFILLLGKTLLLIKKTYFSNKILLYIVLLGGVLFHLLWEANPKYSLNFIMLLLFIAVDFIDDIAALEPMKAYYNKFIPKLFTGFIVLTAALSIILYLPLTKDKLKYNDLVQGQITSNKERIRDMYNEASLLQSFSTNRTFNSLTIQAKNETKNLDAVYRMDLLDENSSVLYSSQFSPKQKGAIEYIEFDFDKVTPSKRCTYYIKISTVSASPDQQLFFCMSSKEGYDVFPRGELFFNGENIYGDLAFTVNDKFEEPFISSSFYLLLITGILLLELGICFYAKKES